MGFLPFSTMFSDVIHFLLPALFIDIGLSSLLYKRQKYALLSYLPSPLYFVGSLIWAYHRVQNNSSYLGWGGIALMIIVGWGFGFSMVRLALGIKFLEKLKGR